MLEEEIFRCYESHATIGGRTVRVGVSKSEEVKKAAVIRGFTSSRGELKKRLTAWERLVIVMRDATTAASFNHEWWAAEISKPDWVRRLDTLFANGWLYYPVKKSDLEPRTLGDRIGYQLALEERKLLRAVADSKYRSDAEKFEVAKTVRSWGDRENITKVRLVIPGYDNWKQFAEENAPIMPQLRKLLVMIAGDQPLPDSSKFFEGLVRGTERAKKINLDDPLSGYDEREEILDILRGNWPALDRMKSRSEITDFILERLPEGRRKFLTESRQTPEQLQWKRFVERLRQTYYEPLGLRPRGRGRPAN